MCRDNPNPNPIQNKAAVRTARGENRTRKDQSDVTQQKVMIRTFTCISQPPCRTAYIVHDVAHASQLPRQKSYDSIPSMGFAGDQSEQRTGTCRAGGKLSSIILFPRGVHVAVGGDAVHSLDCVRCRRGCCWAVHPCINTRPELGSKMGLINCESSTKPHKSPSNCYPKPYTDSPERTSQVSRTPAKWSSGAPNLSGTSGRPIRGDSQFCTMIEKASNHAMPLQEMHIASCKKLQIAWTLDCL
jgi:hypothetical protein